MHLKLLTLGHCARVVAALAAHMPEERLSAAETVALPRADFDFTKEVVACRMNAPPAALRLRIREVKAKE